MAVAPSKLPLSNSYDTTNESIAMFINALKSYYKSTDYQYIPLFLEDDIQFPISDCFINLNIVLHEQQKKQEEQSLRKQGNYLRDDKIGSYEEIFEPKKVIHLTEIFNEVEGQSSENHIIISGIAGIGKTTFCQFIVAHWANDQYDKIGKWIDGFDAPILIPLRELLNVSSATTLAEFIHKACLAPNSQEIVTVQAIDTAIKDHQFLYLLDGADEIIEIINNKSHPAYKLFETLKTKTHWILTARPHHISSHSLGNSRHLEIAGFTMPDILRYVNNFFNRFKKDKLFGALIQTISANTNLKGIAHVPIHLELLCSLWKENNGQYDVAHLTMTQLYLKLIIQLFRRSLNKRGIDIKFLLDTDIQQDNYMQAVIQALKSIAWQMLHDNLLVLETRKYQQQLIACKGQLEQGPFFNMLFDKAHMLKPVGDQKAQYNDRKYYFLHLTFQEFFAAWHIVDCINSNKAPVGYSSLEQLFLKIQLNPRYEIMWWFVAGLMQEYAPDKRPLFFNLTMLAEKKCLTPYVRLQSVRYQEESNFYQFTQQNKMFYDMSEFVDGLAKVHGPYALLLVHYLNFSPDFCQQLSMEDLLLQLLNKYIVDKTNQFKAILSLAGNCRFSQIKTLAYLQTSLRNEQYKIQWETIIEGMAMIINNHWQLIASIDHVYLLQLTKQNNSENLIYNVLKMTAFFPVDVDTQKFVNMCLKDKVNENIIKQALIVIRFWVEERKLLFDSSAIKKSIIAILCKETGWLLSEAAKALVTLADMGEAYEELIMGLLDGTIEVVRNGSFRPTKQYENTVNFSLSYYPFAEVIAALIKTEYKPIIGYLLDLYAKNVKKINKKNIVLRLLSCLIHAEYTNKELADDIFSLIENFKIDLEIRELALSYFCHMPAIAIRYRERLQALLNNKNPLLLKVIAASVILKLSNTDEEAVKIIIRGLFESSTFIRAEAASALHSIQLSEANIDQLILALDQPEFIIENIILVAFKSLIISNLAKHINDFPTILSNIYKLANSDAEKHNHIYIAEAFGKLINLPNSIVDTLIKWITLSKHNRQEDLPLIAKATEVCTRFVMRCDYLQQRITPRLSRRHGLQWLWLAAILAPVGKLGPDDLRKIVDTVANPMSQSILVIFARSGSAQLSLLIDTLLPYVDNLDIKNNYVNQSFYIYHILSQFDLTAYLGVLRQKHMLLLFQNTPTKELVKAYFQYKIIHYLDLFCFRVAVKQIIMSVEAGKLVWYEKNQQHEIDVPTEIEADFLAAVREFFSIKNRCANPSVDSSDQLPTFNR